MHSRFLTMTLFPVMGLMLAAAGPAGAQSHVFGNAPAAYERDDYRAPYADAQRSAFDNGYRDGRKRGEQAARDNRPFDVQRERDYRNAEAGYNRSLGDRNRYRDNYRGGFTQGYREGYERRDTRGAYPGGIRDDNRGWGSGNGGYGGYGDNRGLGGNRGYGGSASYGAYQNGASDGYKKGLDDVNDRKRPDVTRQKWYRSGDHDYDSRYGAKETYRVEYRRGFEEGYNRAYRERR